MFRKITFTDRAVVNVIRTLMFLAFAFNFIDVLDAWLNAFWGDTSKVFELEDIKSAQGPLVMWKLFVGVSLYSVLFVSIGWAFWSVHKFFKQFLKRQAFDVDIAISIRNIAIGLIGFWVFIVLIDGLMPFVLTYGYQETKMSLFNLIPLDIELVFGVIGVTLLAVAVLLKRGLELQEESQQII